MKSQLTFFRQTRYTLSSFTQPKLNSTGYLALMVVPGCTAENLVDIHSQRIATHGGGVVIRYLTHTSWPFDDSHPRSSPRLQSLGPKPPLVGVSGIAKRERNSTLCLRSNIAQSQVGTCFMD